MHLCLGHEKCQLLLHITFGTRYSRICRQALPSWVAWESLWYLSLPATQVGNRRHPTQNRADYAVGINCTQKISKISFLTHIKSITSSKYSPWHLSFACWLRFADQEGKKAGCKHLAPAIRCFNKEMICVTSINNFLAKASHRVMTIFEGEGKYNAPHAQKSGAQILAYCSNIFCNTGSLYPNTYLGVLESLSLVHGSLFGTRKDQGKIWKMTWDF